MPRIDVVRDGVVVRQVELSGADLRIGRAADNDLVLEDPEKVVSRLHAEVRRESGEYVIVDLDSGNGIWRGRDAVDRAVLVDGLEIGIGPYTLRFSGFSRELRPAPEGDNADRSPVSGTLRLTRDTGVPDVKQSEPVARKSKRTPGPPASLPKPGFVAWLARQPKPLVLGGFVAIVVVLIAIGQVINREPDTRAQDDAQKRAADARREQAASQVKGLIDEARTALDQSRPSDAVAALVKALVIDPGNGDALQLKVQADDAVARAAEAERIAQEEREKPPEPPLPKRVERTPRTPTPTWPLLTRRPDEAIPAWHERSRVVAERYSQARDLMGRGELAEAVVLLGPIVADEPGYESAAALLTEARAGLVRRADEAIDSGLKLEAAGDLTGALSEYQRAQSLDPGRSRITALMAALNTRMLAEGSELLTRAKQYDALGRQAEAIEHYEKALKLLAANDSRAVAARARLKELRGGR